MKNNIMASNDPFNPLDDGVPVNFARVRASHDFTRLTIEGQGAYFIFLLKMYPTRLQAQCSLPDSISVFVEGKDSVEVFDNFIDWVLEDREDELSVDYLEDGLTDLLAFKIIDIEDKNFVTLELRDIIF